MKKFFRRALTALLIVATLLTASFVYAAIQTFDGVGEWHTSDAETEKMAKARAQQRAQLDAQKKAGVYLKTFSHSVNLELVDDEISAVNANIIEIVGDVHFDKKIIPLSDNQTTILYTATLKAKIDPDGIYDFVKRTDEAKVKIIVEQNNGLQDAIRRNDELAVSLTEQYNRATSQADKDRIRQQMEQADREFLSNQKFKEGNKLYSADDYDGAIKFLNEALELNPNNEGAKWCLYTSLSDRGKHYLDTGKYELAVKDYTTSIALAKTIEHDSWRSYYDYLFRGLSYGGCKQYDLAIKDFNRSIEFLDDDYAAYFTRGTAYFFLKQYGQAIQDLDKSVELFDQYYHFANPKYFISNLKFDAVAIHFIRGLVYQALGDKEKARSDFAKVRELIEEFDPTGETLRAQVGILYQQLGDKKAQDVLNKARQLGYKG